VFSVSTRINRNKKYTVTITMINFEGAAYGPKVRKWMTATVPANLGQGFVAINPDCFAPGFEERLSDLLGILRGLPPVIDCINLNP